MPIIGEIKYGKEIYKPNKEAKFIWLACPDCKKERWLILHDNKPNEILCYNCKIITPHEPPERRVWRYVSVKENNECWEWIGTKNSDGYGMFWNGITMVLASRYIYEQVNNKKIDSNIYICHSCDNPSCVNFNHLFEGTQKDNMQDFSKKYKNSKKLHLNCGLTEKEIKEIKNKLINLKHGDITKIAKEYHIDRSIISLINSGKRYENV